MLYMEFRPETRKTMDKHLRIVLDDTCAEQVDAAARANGWILEGVDRGDERRRIPALGGVSRLAAAGARIRSGSGTPQVRGDHARAAGAAPLGPALISDPAAPSSRAFSSARKTRAGPCRSPAMPARCCR